MISKIDFRMFPALLEKSWRVLLRKHFTLFVFLALVYQEGVKLWEPLGADPHLLISHYPLDTVGLVICSPVPSAEPLNMWERRIQLPSMS